MESLKQVLLKKYLKNKELDNFYLSVIIINFGIALISLFVPIYLYTLGYSIPKIIFFFFLWSLYHLIFSYPATKITSKIGFKHSMLLATPFTIIYYIGLNFIQTYEILFYILPLINAFQTLFYWYGYHLLFFTSSHKKQRGKELSWIYIMTYISTAIAPLIGGLIAKESFLILFSIGSFFVLISSIPLFFTKENYCPQHFTLKSLYQDIISKKEKRDTIAFVGYALESILQKVIWPIYLIIILATFTKTGFIVSITTLISLIAVYTSGKLSDKYSKIRLIRIFTFLHSLAWIFRIFATSTTKIFFIDSYKSLTEKFLHIPWSAKIYDLAEKRDYFKFIVFQHLIYHLTRVIILPLIILIFIWDFHPFTITFIIAAISSILYAVINRK